MSEKQIEGQGGIPLKKGIVFIILLFVAVMGVSILGAYLITRPTDGLKLGDRVAVIEVYGKISMSGVSNPLGETDVEPRRIRKMIEKAEKDRSVKAIVFDINSPGGSVVASEEIADAIKEVEKPTVAWLGEVAASGGYYVASACDHIVADRSSITGSIGVISIYPEYSGLLQKLGINMTVVKAGEFKDFSSGFRPMTDKEREMVDKIVQSVYEDFIAEIAENRGMSKGEVELLSEGKLYIGKDAVKNGLADEVGNRDRAIKVAAEMGGIEGEPQVEVYKKTAFLEGFVGTAFEKFGYGFAEGLSESVRTVEMGKATF